MKILLRKSVDGHTNLFEWSPNGHSWYPINYRKIVAVSKVQKSPPNGDPDPFKAVAPFRQAMNNMREHQGFFISVWNAEYDRQTKVLRLKS